MELCTVSPDEEVDLELLRTRMKPLVESHPSVAYIYIVLMSGALIVGTGGNFLILTVIGAMRNLQRTGKVFIINMALADLCVAAVADPMCVLAVIKGEGWFDDKRWLCEGVASMCLTACFCAFLSLSLASFNRYVFICHHNIYDKIFTTKSCICLCISAWVGAFFFEVPNFFGWGGHYFDAKSHQCIWDRTASLSYTMFVSLVLIFSPLFLMLICYILIFRHIYVIKLNLHQFQDKDTDPKRMRKTWLETLRTSRMLLGIFVVFLVCWTPYAIVIIFDFYKKLSTEMHLFVTMLAHFHSSANCIVYTITNRNFRTGVMRRFGCGSCGRASLSSESDTKSTEIAKISASRLTNVASSGSNRSNDSTD
ncbi:melatonin receptor type 1B-like [Littorina saxatilis]|uniref:melatonin receptor type 1B-like n=1 Tax=Littorina saxatilis TaxID=31220 RepID=UPI0038B5D4B9